MTLGMGVWMLKPLSEYVEGIRIGTQGLLLGRDPSCDVVLMDRKASRVHALLHPGPGGLDLIALGRRGVLLNGRVVSDRVPLSSGDQLVVPGLEFMVQGPADHQPRRQGFAIDVNSAILVGLTRGPVTFGGTPRDSVLLAGLPEHAAVAYALAGGAAISLSIPGHIGEVPVNAEEVVVLSTHQVVRLGPHRLVLKTDGASETATATPSGQELLPRRVRFEFKPVGGLLEVALSVGTVASYLPELRARLIATLLNPPGEYAVGDFVPDELVIPLVWPGDSGKTRSDMNTLVFRTRKTLAKQGISPDVVARATHGNATRFAVHPDAEVHFS